MKNFLLKTRAFLGWLWMTASLPFYSLLCIGLSFFHRKAAYYIGWLWCRHLLAVHGIVTKVEGLEKIQPHQKYILVCNHQSNLDIAVLIANLQLYLSFIAKKELFQIPFFGWGINALGHIPIDRSSPRKARMSFIKAGEKVKQAKELSLVIFPEGTRSHDGKVHEFKQGSFTLVLDTRLPIIPIGISGTYQALPKNRLWAYPAQVTLSVGEVIEPRALDKRQIARLTQQHVIDLVAEQ